MDYKKEIEKFIDSVLQGFGPMDLSTLNDTVVWYVYDPLIAKAWSKRILKMVNDLEKSGLSKKEIVKLFPNMSELRCKAWFDLWTIKYSNLSKDERIKIAQFYIDLLNEGALEDPYAFGSNIIHTKNEIDSLLNKVKPARPQITKKIGRLISACYHFGHAAYSDMNPSIVYENYGPYDIKHQYSADHILAIKDFDNLQCPQLWSETENFPWMHINILNVYHNVEMKMDAISHVIFTGDLINNLKYYYLEIDGVEFDTDKLDIISEKIEKLAIEIFQKFQALDPEARKVKYYHQKAYAYKKIYDYLQQDWRPSEEMLSEQANKPLYKIEWPEGNQLKELFRKMFDPYEDFPKEIPKI